MIYMGLYDAQIEAPQRPLRAPYIGALIKARISGVYDAQIPAPARPDSALTRPYVSGGCERNRPSGPALRPPQGGPYVAQIGLSERPLIRPYIEGPYRAHYVAQIQAASPNPVAHGALYVPSPKGSGLRALHNPPYIGWLERPMLRRSVMKRFRHGPHKRPDVAQI